MIRNTRQNTTLSSTKRNIQTVWIDFKQEEKEVYSELESAFAGFSSFSKITFLREICSSREACYLSLKKLNETNPNPFIEQVNSKIEKLPHHSKAEKLVELIKQFGDEKVIVFTEYRASQIYLQWILKQHGITSVPFRGGFKRGKKIG